MATFLSRLGRSAFRRRRLVAGLWVTLLAAFGIAALAMSGKPTTSISIPGTESQRAIQHLEQRFPEASANGATARVAIAAPEGGTLDRGAVAGVVEQLRDAPKVTSVAGPFQSRTVSPDGRIALAQVHYQVQSFDLTEADRNALQATAEPGRAAGLTIEFGGNAMQGIPVTQPTEAIGVIVAAVVLAITFGSLIAAGLPLVTALIGVGIGMAGISAATGVLDLNANTPVLALMIGLAVGIDYALFIVSRYRNELTRGAALEDAAARAVGTAGSAVVFAGLTVIVALAGLTVVGVPILGEMGLAASATVAIAVLIAVTLLPAALGFAGSKVLGSRVPGLRRLGNDTVAASGSDADGAGARGPRGAGERWAAFVGRHRMPVLVLTVLSLGVLAIPMSDMRLGLPTDHTAPPDSTRRQAYELISEGFGPGMNGPLLVVLDIESAPRRTAGTAARRISALPGVAQVSPPRFNRTGDTALLNVIPTTGPDSAATEDLVGTIRDQGERLRDETGTAMSVTGRTAMNIDVSRKLSDALPPYLGLVVGLAFLLLMVVFRSVLVPLKAALGFLGSVGATFGAVVAVFQWGWLGDVFGVEATGPIMSVLPILLIGVLFGLAMDYQVFLVTRMREEYVHGQSPRRAMITGFGHGSRVVVAAALIMTSVFAGFVLAQNTLIQSIGFALAFGVAIDAFVVRMTLVPAVMSLLGKAAWWMPGWLGRVLPDVDVEGEKIAGGPPSEGGGGDRTLEPV